MKKRKQKMPKWVIWLNLIIGFYNIYLFVNDWWWFNIVIGSLNIGVWVFNRDDFLIIH